MSKLLTALAAAGFAFGLGAAAAQDVKSDREKAKGQEEIMQQKDQGTGQAAQGNRERPTADTGRNAVSDTNNGGTQDPNAAKDPNASAQDQGTADQSKKTDQGTKKKRMQQ